MQMVNGRFPAPALYGFEIVDAAVKAIVLQKAVINRKFTPNSINRSFRKFSAI